VLSAGILLFIFWDVMDAAHDGLESSLEIAKSGGGWGAFAARSVTPMAGGSSVAAVAGGPETAGLQAEAGRAALVLGMLIAVAIGLHNFSEGLAIGVSARAGTVALATTLIVGFALHNATEGFGIVGPLNGIRPSWRWLLVAGLVGGGPTFLGTLVGYRVTSPALEISFYALAAGAIIYVVGQLWTGAARRLPPSLVLGGIVLGFTLGMASDLVLTYGGG
jgi:ZIP family zinc transporter